MMWVDMIEFGGEGQTAETPKSSWMEMKCSIKSGPGSQ